MGRDSASAMFTWTCCESKMENGGSWRRSWRGQWQDNLGRSDFPCVSLCIPVSPVVKILFNHRGHRGTQGKSTGELLLLRSQPVLPVRPEEPCDPAQQQNSDDRVELMEVLAERAPVLAKLHAQVSQRETPGPRSEESIDVEFSARHAGDSGGQRNERADHRQQARNKHGHISPALKKSVSPIQFTPPPQKPPPHNHAPRGGAPDTNNT